MAFASGASIAGYTVVRMLGSSATGEVYLVQQPGSPGWRALKVLTPAMSQDDEFLRRFHRDAPIAAQLFHPNILEVHDHGELDGRLWIAMDHVDSIDAAQLMRERFPVVLPVDEVLAMVTAVAGALDYAYQRGLVHRDVKPASIQLSRPGEGESQILLADFGLAVPPGFTDEALAFPAPEQGSGADIDGRADQYALAATAIHLLTGVAPVVSSHVAPPKLDELRPDLARLDGVLSRALATEPNDRFASCREFTDALNEQAGGVVADSGPEAMDAHPPLDDVATTYVVDYPAYAWPDVENSAQPPDVPLRPEPTRPRWGARRPKRVKAARAPRLGEYSAATRRSARRIARRILVGAASVILLAGLVGVGFVFGRRTTTTTTPAASQTSESAANGPATGVPPPEPLDGTYSVEVRRSQQTYNFTPAPQPPDVVTWWAIRSSCTPTGCLAAGVLLDDHDQSRAKLPHLPPLLLEFGGGLWRSRPDRVKFPCVEPKGAANTQATTQVLTLRPEAHGELVGQVVVTVHSDECGEQGAVIRIPAVVSRHSEIPPAVTVPNPAQLPAVPPGASPEPPATTTTTTPSTTVSGPGG